MAMTHGKTMTDDTKVLQDPKDAFVESILAALGRISKDGAAGNKQRLIYKTLDALKLLSSGDLDGRLRAEHIAKIDVFTPIISCHGWKLKWDVLASYMAIFSVHRELQPLITGNITSWFHLLPSQEISLAEGDSSSSRGFYSVVSQLSEVHVLGPETFEYLELDLAPTLVASWVPMWLQWLEKGRPILTDVDLLDESKVDFYIATSGKEFAEQYACEGKGDCLGYFSSKICQRMARFPFWVSQPSYGLVAQRVTPKRPKFDDISFALQVVMEVVDHPELNFFETPQLAFLLSNALKRMQKVPCHILHATLGPLASVQSLSALVNMSQYVLAKFLVNAGEVARLINMRSHLDVKPDDNSWYKSKPSLFQIPHWFEESIMPPIPPISKSSFVFQNSALGTKDGYLGLEIVTDLLLDSLSTVSLLNQKILEEYQELGIDPMQHNGAADVLSSTILHKLKQNYTELYLIPVATTLILCCQLTSTENKIIGKTKAQTVSRLLYFHTMRLSEELIRTHGGSGLFYLIEFATKVSSEDLLLHRVFNELLNHLFFQSRDNSARRICEENVLVKSSLLDYVTFWNDGTKTFENFFVQVFGQSQPTIKTFGSIDLDDMIRFLPDGEDILAKKRSRSKKVHSKQAKQSNFPRGQDSTPAGTLQQNKFNPYSATPFVPAKKSTRSLLVNSTNRAVTYGYQATHHEDLLLNEMSSNHSAISNSFNCNGEISTIGTGDHLSANVIPEKFSFDLGNTTNQLDITPRTPNLTSTSTLFNSPWNDFSDIQSTPNTHKIVSTGKNYILGGHSRIRNNSRAQSIHIDNFDRENYGQ